jgi:hypothetical protein
MNTEYLSLDFENQLLADLLLLTLQLIIWKHSKDLKKINKQDPLVTIQR